MRWATSNASSSSSRGSRAMSRAVDRVKSVRRTRDPFCTERPHRPRSGSVPSVGRLRRAPCEVPPPWAAPKADGDHQHCCQTFTRPLVQRTIPITSNPCRSRVGPCDRSDRIDSPQVGAELPRVMLHVTEVVDVELATRDLPVGKPHGPWSDSAVSAARVSSNFWRQIGT